MHIHNTTPLYSQVKGKRFIYGIKPNSADSSKGTHRIDAMESGFTEGTPRIGGIGISGSGESFIMIEGEIFHEGDFVKGFKIKKINGRTVEFQKDGQIWVQHPAD